MDKKELQQYYLEAYAEGDRGVIEVLDVWQDRPSTAVMVIVHYPVEDYAYGFSKANWPDKWDEMRGYNLAVEKAIGKLARRNSD